MRAWILVGLVVLSSGCQKFNLGNLNLKEYLPRVSYDQMKVETVDFEGMDTNFDFNVENPYPVGLNLASFDYDLKLEQAAFLNSASSDGIALPAATTSKMAMPARIRFAEVIELVQNIGGKDEVDFGLTGKFGVNTPAGAVDVPFDEAGKLPVLKAPKVEPKQVRVGQINLLRNRASIEIDLDITNKAATQTYGLKDFAYGLDLAGARVLDGNLAEMTLAPGATETVTLPVQLNLLELGSTIVSSLTQKRPLDLRVDAGMGVETPLGRIPLQIDKSTSVPVQ